MCSSTGLRYTQDYGKPTIDKPSLCTISSKQDRCSNEELHISTVRESGRRLSLKGEAGANLVGGLVQVLGIEGGTEAEGDTGAEQDVVGQSGDTTVVDLGL